MQYIAVLMTCHNRVNTTLRCLKSLFEANLPEGLKIEVFLVDDGSSDNTGKIIKKTYPEVNIIQGTGNLYCNGGICLAWKTAAAYKDYDFYIWLNDDTILFKTALVDIFNDFQKVKHLSDFPFIISGACCDKDTGKVTYSGKRHLNDPVDISITGEPQQCAFINGNFVLIPKETYSYIGNLSEQILHRFGDYEYSARLIKMGGTCWVSSKHCAFCKKDILKCFDPSISLFRRIKSLHSPIGLGIKDDILFKKNYYNKEWGKWGLSIIKKYFLCLFPSQYNYIKMKIHNLRRKDD